jgi:hypothetical protein
LLTRNQIVTLLYDDKDFNEIIEAYSPKRNLERHKEFKQFMLVEILEMDEKKLLKLYDKGKLMFYIARMCELQVASSSSKWFRRYVRPLSQCSSSINQIDGRNMIDTHTPEKQYIEQEHQEQIDKKLQLIEEAISYHLQRNPLLKPHFDIFNMRHKDQMCCRKINKKTRIPVTRCYKYLKLAKALIKKYIYEDEPITE